MVLAIEKKNSTIVTTKVLPYDHYRAEGFGVSCWTRHRSRPSSFYLPFILTITEQKGSGSAVGLGIGLTVVLLFAFYFDHYRAEGFGFSCWTRHRSDRRPSICLLF